MKHSSVNHLLASKSPIFATLDLTSIYTQGIQGLFGTLLSIFFIISCAESPKNSPTTTLNPTIENAPTGTNQPVLTSESNPLNSTATSVTPSISEESNSIQQPTIGKRVNKSARQRSMSSGISKVADSVSARNPKPTPVLSFPPFSEKQSQTIEPIPSNKIETQEPNSVKKPISKPTHAAWSDLLQKHVSVSGKVSYKGFKTDISSLEAYLKTLADNPPKEDWTREEKMAYWINAYNAFTVNLILDNWPVASILKLDNGKTWDVKRIQLGNKKYSLNQIENEILRPQFKDARIHFAVNCAAKSCPPLLNRAFTAENLEQQLEAQTRKFINDTKFNQISANKAVVSKIFEWYAADFGDLKKYLNRYSTTPLNPGASVSFDEYDWDLND